MRYSSFVIRLWQREDDADPDGSIHGRIEHVQSDAVSTISCLDDVTAFLLLFLGTLPEPEETRLDE